MIPVLMCAYRPTYLDATLKWLKTPEFETRYRLFAWDNGGADTALRRFGLQWQCSRDEATGRVHNLGKALAMRHLVDRALDELPQADCFVCIDDDIVVNTEHLDALVSAARRPGIGMVGGQMHPFNSAVPPGGAITPLDACRSCAKASFRITGYGPCARCAGTGKDPQGLRLLTFPAENRTVHHMGQVAGGLFAVSRTALDKLSWAPYLYPVLADDRHEPVPYWTEDATLDHGLTAAGLLDGYLDAPGVAPAIHLPDLDPEYVRWKEKARVAPRSTPAYFDRLS